MKKKFNVQLSRTLDDWAIIANFDSMMNRRCFCETSRWFPCSIAHLTDISRGIGRSKYSTLNGSSIHHTMFRGEITEMNWFIALIYMSVLCVGWLVVGQCTVFSTSWLDGFAEIVLAQSLNKHFKKVHLQSDKDIMKDNILHFLVQLAQS